MPSGDASPNESADGTIDGGTDGGMPSGDASSNESTDGAIDGGSDASAAYVEPTNCNLRNDTGGPGQYSDTCVKRSWIAPYAGMYTSSACALTIRVDGPVAALFVIERLSASGPDVHEILWEGGGGLGNDSYYRFTTDATFATTKTLNFTAAQRVDSGERSTSLRIEGLDVGAIVYRARYFDTSSGNNIDLDCGIMTKL